MLWCAAGCLGGLVSGFMAGCENTLETGYVYHPLNSNDVERRAYYAPAFSPESHVPKRETGSGFNLGQ